MAVSHDDAVNPPRFVARRHYYARGGDKRLYAYSPAEWGMGGSLPSGGNYTIRSWVVQIILAVIMVPVALFSAAITAFAITQSNFVVMIIGLVCTPIFLIAPYVGFIAARREFEARKARMLRGLPKPTTSVTDESAREYFETHPELGIEITKENFPDARWSD